MADSDPILLLEGVVAGYGKMTILHGTGATIRRGAITTVIGPNGAGKSTMFKAIFGLIEVREGRIVLDGRETTNRTPRQMLDGGGMQHASHATSVTGIPSGRFCLDQSTSCPRARSSFSIADSGRL